jgi:hypothetical protein
MNRAWRIWAASLVAWCVLLPATPAPVTAAANTLSSISVGGVWAFNITQPAAGMSADERVVEVRRRITEVLSRYRAGQQVPVLVRPWGAAATVEVGGIVVVTVTPADATGTAVTPFELAQQWARRLRQGLAAALPGATFPGS